MFALDQANIEQTLQLMKIVQSHNEKKRDKKNSQKSIDAKPKLILWINWMGGEFTISKLVN